MKPSSTPVLWLVLIFGLASNGWAQGVGIQAASRNAPESAITKTSTDCLPPPTGIVSWWQGEGNAADTVGGNNGSLAPGVTFGPALVGQGFYLNNANAYVAIPASSSLNIGANGSGLTLEAWICLTNVNAFHPIFEWNQGFIGGTWGLQLWLGSQPSDVGSLFANVVDINGNSHGIQSAQNIVVANQFQHVALTYDPASGNATLYVNGNVVAQQDIGNIVPQTTYNLYFGTRLSDSSGEWTYGAFLGGILDEPTIYSRALSQAEIAAIYNAGSAGKCTEPFPPEIVTQPASQTVLAGGAAVFGVVPAGTGPLAYQWAFAGHNIVGATNAWLSLTNLHPAQAGNYAVKISSPYGSASSSNALLTILAQNILIYKYAGEEIFVTKGEELTFPYSGLMFFLPDNTNGAYVGWASIQGKKTYWINSISQSLWINIPGNTGQSYTLFGDAGSGFDDHGQAHFHSNLLRGWNTTLSIGTRKTFVFPNTFAGEDTRAYPDAETGQMKLDHASSTFTFAAPNTQTANNSGQTLADLINVQIKTLESEGYQAQ